jgi:UDP-N-acetylglucosamine--N-acetylmuramyl-(pentapeptide) pyrophosphoryl-undecaprenol N-acetylglucosamine transferase
MEMEKVPAAGYKIVGLNISGLQRSISLKNLLLPFKVLKSIMSARKIISSFSPDVAIGVGGYASGPLLYAATMMKVPSLIQEQNSFAGITNKMLGKRVQKICVAYEGMDRFFQKEKIIKTGNPVREETVAVENKRDEAIRFFSLDPTRKTIFVTGGSLGARTINETIEGILGDLARNNIQLIWQTGKPFGMRAKEAAGRHSSSGIYAYEFITRMDYAYAVADIVIARAGASSVSELTLVAKPAILIPSPNVAEDHQTKNAMSLVDANAAVLIKDIECKNKLLPAILALLKDEKKQSSLKENIARLAIGDSAGRIVDEVYNIVKIKS